METWRLASHSGPSPLEAALSAFLLDREARRCTSKTLEHDAYTVGGFVRYLQAQGVPDPQAIEPHDIRAYLVSLQHRGLKDTTQHAHARGIKTWLRWLVREGDLAVSPMERVAMPRLEHRIPAPFTPQEVHALLAACRRHLKLGARNYAIVLTLLDTGLRASEFCSLRVGDVDLRSGLAMVMGKGRKQRQVRVGAKARGAIVRMLGWHQDTTAGTALWMGYDVNGHPRGALTTSGIQSVLRRLGQKAGVMPCSPHRFRRTFALWMLRDGCDLHTLRLMMGHSTLAVLQRYLALAGEDIERAHKLHSPADRLLEGG
jgi:integrase/recombinase XerC